VWTLEEAATLGHDFVAKLYGACETFFLFLCLSTFRNNTQQHISDYWESI
tara:strand:- start:421 stop:570 length:150 start_codon:yes stop_codon:yes gene_type:complete